MNYSLGIFLTKIGNGRKKVSTTQFVAPGQLFSLSSSLSLKNKDILGTMDAKHNYGNLWENRQKR